MRIRISLIIGVLVLSLPSIAQQMELISFSETTYDFGKVNEEDGPIIHEFSFKNNGEDPIQILGVKASCGCTTPSWTKEPIMPGKIGLIQAQYDPKNRPGTFNKSLTVSTNIDESLSLFIRGEVIPEAKSITEELPTEMGGIRMRYTSLNLGKVFLNKEPVSEEFKLYNQSDKTITFLEKYEAPKHIKLVFEPKMLAPQSEGLVRIVYDVKLKNDLGFMNDRVTFHTDEAPEASVKDISVFATIEEYFGQITKEELEKAPQLKAENNVHDFGRVKQGSVVTTEFTITNTGVTDLVIRKISPNCTCVVGTMKNEKIKPGLSATLKVAFDPEGRKGNQQKSVTLYSNDPRASAQRVTIKAYLVE
jgi:hypothetical protein